MLALIFPRDFLSLCTLLICIFALFHFSLQLARQTIILLEVTLDFLSVSFHYRMLSLQVVQKVMLCSHSIVYFFDRSKFRSQGVNVWDNSTMNEEDKIELKKRFRLQKDFMHHSVTADISAEEINGETPIFLLYNLKKLIADHVDYNIVTHVNKEMKFYTCVDAFATAYYGLKRLITTPFPFPLSK